MQSDKKNLSERLLDFAASIIKLAIRLNKTSAGRHIGKQLMQSSASAGANYEEACGAESRADFIHKMQVTLKELQETFYRQTALSGLPSSGFPFAQRGRESFLYPCERGLGRGAA